MKKRLSFLLLFCTSLTFASEQEERGKELCNFTSRVFNVLEQQSSLITEEKLDGAYTSFIEQIKQYETDPNPEISDIAEKLILSFKSGEDTAGTLADAVSGLGRLLKCSVDDDYYRIDTAYLLHREDLSRQISLIEEKLGDNLPDPAVNYHRLMIESLADERYDLALYAYLKIAESRCILERGDL